MLLPLDPSHLTDPNLSVAVFKVIIYRFLGTMVLAQASCHRVSARAYVNYRMCAQADRT